MEDRSSTTWLETSGNTTSGVCQMAYRALTKRWAWSAVVPLLKVTAACTAGQQVGGCRTMGHTAQGCPDWATVQTSRWAAGLITYSHRRCDDCIIAA